MKGLRVSMHSVRCWLVLASGLALASSGFGQGTIVYMRPDEPLYNVPSRELDLNSDGQAECQFYAVSESNIYFATDASGIGSAQLLVTPQGQFGDLGSDLLGLTDGYLVGGSLPPEWFWADGDAPNLYGQARVLSVFLPDTVPSIVVPGGDFYGQTAFMGIHFPIGADWHYGWVRIRGGRWGDELTLVPPSWIVDWAYETRPNTPILAGAVPEPSMCGLLMIGIGVMLSRCFGRSL